MNKLKLAVLVVGMILVGAKAHAGLIGGSNGSFYSVVEATSSLVYSGSGRLFKIVLSSGANTTAAVALDTSAIAIFGTFDGAAQQPFQMTPKLAFSSTATLGGFSTGVQAVDFGQDGVRFKTGLHIVTNDSTNGVGVYWKPD